MLMAVFLFAIGLVLLIKGGDWFVDGATGIAHRFNMPELLIGATVVSIGTTLPEVMVSSSAAIMGHGQIAYGNAIGSIICNTSLILALAMAIRPGKVQRKTMIVPVIFFFVAAAFYAGVAYIQGSFSRITGILLLIIFVVYMVKLVRDAIHADSEDEMTSGENETKPRKLIWDIVSLVVGAVCIAVGADLLVDNGTIIAEQLGVPESVIALTFVALGTSLPELVTAITSLVKGHGALSLGNIIGANIFNLVLVSGLSVTLNPFEVPADKVIAGVNASLVVDIPLMFAVMIIACVPALAKGKMSRWQGITLLALYLGYICFQFI